MKTNENGAAEEEEDHVGAFGVSAKSDKGVDYEKLIKKFGCFKIEPYMIKKFEELTS